jgi:arsenate reductase
MKLDQLFSNAPAADRIKQLETIAKAFSREDILKVNFICTHNSRRSHFSEILFRTAALYYGLRNVHTYSGGTEGTALYPAVAESCQRFGFEILEMEAHGQRAWKIYHPDLETKESTPLLFSKVYSHELNAQEGYHAVMVCDSANEACPVVFGAKQRHPLMFIDPKRSDGTQEQAKVYDETLALIASELGYIARRVSELI